MTTAPDRPDVHDRILDEATVLFERHGFHGVSMRQVAEAAGVSKAGLYYHVHDKERLFLGVLLRAIARIGDHVDEATAGGGRARAQVRRVLRAIVTRMRGSERIMRLAEQDAVHLSEEARARMLAAYYARFVEPIRDVLRRGVERGELREVDVPEVTWLLLGQAFAGLSAPPERADSLVDAMVEVFFDGVAARAGTPQ